MRKAGGFTALVAGVFATIAAAFTLFFIGGALAIFEHTSFAIYLGGAGILCSFLVIIFSGMVLFTRSSVPTVLLILSAAIGIYAGGFIVGIFLPFAVIGGIMALFERDPRTRAPIWLKIVGSAIGIASILFFMWVLFYMFVLKPNKPAIDPKQVEYNHDITPEKLGAALGMFSRTTSIEKDQIREWLKGQAVDWEMTISNVSGSDNSITLDAEPRNGLSFECRVRIKKGTPEYEKLAKLQKNDRIRCRGIIEEIGFMNRIKINAFGIDL